MTFHTYRSTGPAKGCRMLNKHGKSFSPRVTVSFSEKDFAKLTSIAANKYGMPVSAFVRDAVERLLKRFPDRPP